MARGALDDWVDGQVEHYPLREALLGRRSRRFGPGMAIPAGPFAFRSERPPEPLSEADEAALVFAAAGLTGYALADLSYGPGQGGSMLADLTGRTVASADSIDTVALFVMNDEATYLVRRPGSLPPGERRTVVELTRAGRLVDAYRRLRVRIADGRTSIPVTPGVNFNINRWAVYAPGSTYFLPVSDLTAVYINALLEAFEPEMALFVVDERRQFLPAGLRRFAKERGGHLWSKPADGRVVTIQGLEMSFAEATATEAGSMLHSLGLMTQALGLGGFCNYARNEYHWFEALGFEMQRMRSTRYAGVNRLVSVLVRLMGQEFEHPYATGLARDGEWLLRAWCPPNFPDMAAAVRAFVASKFGPDGSWRGPADGSAWQAGSAAGSEIGRPSEAAIEATIAYCEHIVGRYGRFPAYAAPYRTVIGYQATTVDPDFYERFFTPDSLTATPRDRPAGRAP
jgi:hypothetical protein